MTNLHYTIKSIVHSKEIKLLRRVGELISENIRSVDIASRYNGGCFAVIFVGSDPGDAMITCERIRLAVENEINAQVSVSIGLAGPGPGELNNTEGLIKNSRCSAYAGKVMR